MIAYLRGSFWGVFIETETLPNLGRLIPTGLPSSLNVYSGGSIGCKYVNDSSTGINTLSPAGQAQAHALWYCALSRGHRNFTSFSQRHAATKT